MEPEIIQGDEDLIPHTRLWSFLVAETHPELWERFVAACAQELAQSKENT